MSTGKQYRFFIYIQLIVLCASTSLHAQVNNNNVYWQQLQAIEALADKNANTALTQAIALKQKLETVHYTNDSVYARVIDRVAFYDFSIHNYVPGQQSFALMQQAISINSGKAGSVNYLIRSYYNLANFYKQLYLYNKALNVFDSVIMYSVKYKVLVNVRLWTRINKIMILNDRGDYLSGVYEAKAGLYDAQQVKDTGNILVFSNWIATCYQRTKMYNDALKYINISMYYLKISPDINIELIALKVMALCYAGMNKDALADNCFSKIKTLQQQSGDDEIRNIVLVDAGNYYETKRNYKEALKAYMQVEAYSLASQDVSRTIRAKLNIAYVFTEQNNYSKAVFYLNQAIKFILPGYNKDFLLNPTAERLNAVAEKELVQVYLNNKAELLLTLYRQQKHTNYLKAALQTSLLADSVLMQMRHDQIEELSKLYWREKTREQYNFAIEASYLSNNIQLAYYFIEKSRAVLLNDNLNELGASSLLPPSEALKQSLLQTQIISAAQMLDTMSSANGLYRQTTNRLFDYKENYNRYIKTLEKKYPAYYQYKYSNNTASLKDLQRYLRKKKAGFISYFTGDSALYIFSATSSSTRLIKLGKKDYCKDSITAFYSLCTNAQKLMNNYSSFSNLSNYLFRLLFQPANLNMNNIIVCPDVFLIPFEALCSDVKGRDFLVKRYVFSYVYSSTFLLHKFSNEKAMGNFLGVAPVSFSKQLDLYSLNQSADVLKTTASYYDGSVLFTNTSATRKNFLANAGNYTIVNILSHAKASNGDEPVLYMCDSAIRLSELQNMQRKATQLIVLSACETNTGKLATGEGIYSLARGFAAAGVPSVAATLWKADELAIYTITSKFNEYLAQGLPKDDALQKAKKDFLKNNPGSNSLPYYWANLVLMGNTDAIQPVHTSGTLIWIFIIAATGAAGFIVWLKLWRRKALLVKKKRSWS